jgi:orotate phosphoribosyltransferase
MTKYNYRPSPMIRLINVRSKVARALHKDKNGLYLFRSNGHVHAAHLILEIIVSRFYEADGVIGLGMKSYPITSSISCLSLMSAFHPLDTLYLNGNCVAGDLPRKSSGLVLVKDAAYQGKDILKAIKILRSLRYKILGAVALIDHEGKVGDLLKKKKLPFYSVFTPDEIITEVKEWKTS